MRIKRIICAVVVGVTGLAICVAIAIAGTNTGNSSGYSHTNLSVPSGGGELGHGIQWEYIPDPHHPGTRLACIHEGADRFNPMTVSCNWEQHNIDVAAQLARTRAGGG